MYFCTVETYNTFTMKKLLISLAMIMMVVTGCNRKTTDATELEVEPYTFIDSVYLETEFSEGYSYYTMNIDVPVSGPDSLKNNIMQWILGGKNETYQQYVQADKTRFFDEEGSEPLSELNSNYTLAEQTDRYVTYIAEGYLYTGGDHNMPWYYGITFGKADGDLFGYDLIDDYEQIEGMVSQTIFNQYFDDENDEMFDGIDIYGNLPLPTNQPWIENDSVVFCYQPYELGPYFPDKSLCKIALIDLEPYMSVKGETFLP